MNAIKKDSEQGPADTAVGDFDGAFARAAVTVDETYTTPDQSHSMMEPHATIAAGAATSSRSGLPIR